MGTTDQKKKKLMHGHNFRRAGNKENWQKNKHSIGGPLCGSRLVVLYNYHNKLINVFSNYIF